MKVDEDLPPFYGIVRLSQRENLTKMYNNMKKNFGFEFTDPDTIEALNQAPYPTKTIVGTPWYSVLSNPNYINEFNFVGSYVAERDKILVDGYVDPEPEKHGDAYEQLVKCRNEQSDLVLIMLQLAYIPDIVIQEVDFTKAGWSY